MEGKLEAVIPLHFVVLVRRLHVELARPRPPLINDHHQLELLPSPSLPASWENIYYRVKWRKQIFCSIQHYLQLLQQSHYLAVCQSQGSISTHYGQRKALEELPGDHHFI